MKTVKVFELSVHALDWAVAKCEGHEPFSDGISWIIEKTGIPRWVQLPKYSADWAQGGPIIEREHIELGMRNDYWVAVMHLEDGGIESSGPTPLIAAMRCYVASKLGDRVEIPDEL